MTQQLGIGGRLESTQASRNSEVACQRRRQSQLAYRHIPTKDFTKATAKLIKVFVSVCSVIRWMDSTKYVVLGQTNRLIDYLGT